ncbi:MAG: leukotoxin LktA family filamentous adhesin [Cyanobacteriota bacterium]
MKKTKRIKYSHLKLKVKYKIATCSMLLAVHFFCCLNVIWGQDIIIDNKTETFLNQSNNLSVITTSTIKNRSAFNSFNKFNVSHGKTVNLIVPDSVDYLINLIHLDHSTINGILNTVKNNQISGNVLFVNPYGVTIGPGGVINAGSFTTITPTKDFMNNIFGLSGSIDDASVDAIINGSAPINENASIINYGTINAIDSVVVHAGNFVNYGNVFTDATFIGNINTGDIVNTNSPGQPSLMDAEKLTLENGRIIVKAHKDAIQSGNLVAGKEINISGNSLKLNPESNIYSSKDIIISANKVSYMPVYNDDKIINLLDKYIQLDRPSLSELFEYYNSLKSSKPGLIAGNKLIIGRNTDGNIFVGDINDTGKMNLDSNTMLLDPDWLNNFSYENLIIGNNINTNQHTKQITLQGPVFSNNNIEINSADKISVTDFINLFEINTNNKLEYNLAKSNNLKTIINYSPSKKLDLNEILTIELMKYNGIKKILENSNITVEDYQKYKSFGMLGTLALSTRLKNISLDKDTFQTINDYKSLSESDIDLIRDNIFLSSIDLKDFADRNLLNDSDISLIMKNAQAKAKNVKLESSEIEINKGSRLTASENVVLVSDSIDIDLSSEYTGINAGVDAVFSKKTRGNLVISSNNFDDINPEDSLINPDIFEKVNCRLVIGNDKSSNDNTNVIILADKLKRKEDIKFSTALMILLMPDSSLISDNNIDLITGFNFLMLPNSEIITGETLTVQGLSNMEGFLVLLKDAHVKAKKIIVNNFYVIVLENESQVEVQEPIKYSNTKYLSVDNVIYTDAIVESEVSLVNNELSEEIYIDDKTLDDLIKIYDHTQVDKKNEDNKLEESLGNYLVQEVLFKGFSFEKEYQADANAIVYAYKADYHPRGLESFLSKIKFLEEKIAESQYMQNNFNSLLDYNHPPSASRIEKIVQIMKRDNMSVENKIINQESYSEILNIMMNK